MVRPARRPAGWVAPGPRPAAPTGLEPCADEDLCYLSGDWRIFQRVDGHRWSLDDLVTAWYAAEEAGAPARLLDLGCGVGSVLLMMAWRFPTARLVGVEAQELSVDLLRRSVAWNGIEARCELRLADLREPHSLPEGAVFDVVTGTPPYFPIGRGDESPLPQRGPCRFEHRGGVEAYCAAMARALAPSGHAVLCETADQSARVVAAAAAAGLRIERQRDVIPRAGKPPLITLFRFRRECLHPPLHEPPLVVRAASGQRTDEFRALRAAMGMPP